jgi:hypothetical protein
LQLFKVSPLLRSLGFADFVFARFLVAFAELRLGCLGEGPSVLITRLGNRKHRETEKRIEETRSRNTKREEKRKKIGRERERERERERRKGRIRVE